MLKIIKDELDNEKVLKTAVEGRDVVVSFLGPAKSISARSIAPGTFTNPYCAIMNAMLQYGVKRIFVMGTPSVHDPQDRSAAMASLAVLGVKTLANAAYKEIVSVRKIFDDKARDLG